MTSVTAEFNQRYIEILKQDKTPFLTVSSRLAVPYFALATNLSTFTYALQHKEPGVTPMDIANILHKIPTSDFATVDDVKEKLSYLIAFGKLITEFLTTPDYVIEAEREILPFYGKELKEFFRHAVFPIESNVTLELCMTLNDVLQELSTLTATLPYTSIELQNLLTTEKVATSLESPLILTSETDYEKIFEQLPTFTYGKAIEVLKAAHEYAPHTIPPAIKGRSDMFVGHPVTHNVYGLLTPWKAYSEFPYFPYTSKNLAEFEEELLSDLAMNAKDNFTALILMNYVHEIAQNYRSTNFTNTIIKHELSNRVCHAIETSLREKLVELENASGISSLESHDSIFSDEILNRKVFINTADEQTVAEALFTLSRFTSLDTPNFSYKYIDLSQLNTIYSPETDKLTLSNFRAALNIYLNVENCDLREQALFNFKYTPEILVRVLTGDKQVHESDYPYDQGFYKSALRLTLQNFDSSLLKYYLFEMPDSEIFTVESQRSSNFFTENFENDGYALSNLISAIPEQDTEVRVAGDTPTFSPDFAKMYLHLSKRLPNKLMILLAAYFDTELFRPLHNLLLEEELPSKISIVDLLALEQKLIRNTAYTPVISDALISTYQTIKTRN